ncbi:GlsB/YeaQ/YmgE family stress response membrane protein [Arcanobacterium hippocoleae]|uniref:Membrane protein YeaQ/YmgE (Transglycosylase-associated protein family) n=1 Tax=Arcanobacterium hippocoleae TaxID=149017 RepID=A0ABU1T2Q9_9ACTO|nr:GlsB/YeaQ/YmgE family stress response membrane protein [Arcanobacterium hippocoleae]MDR6939644.1 putative membrane protein YeaQ/YmgE (transglycosylase-associated protein family) [Arcanobacterium hippocoleae]
MGNIIGTLIFGLVIGALARLFMKGNQNLSIIATMLLGVVGVVIGNLILGAFGYPMDTRGIDWIRWVVCTVCASVTISIYLGMAAKK